MNAIASADKNWGIGCNNGLLLRIPDDMKCFREMTMGKAIVMGRKTQESLPGGYLPGRVNIVLTHDKNYQAEGIFAVHSIEELYRRLEAYHTKDVFVIGGESIYRQLLDDCETVYLTKIDGPIKIATTLNKDCLSTWNEKELKELENTFPNLAPAIKEMKKEAKDDE